MDLTKEQKIMLQEIWNILKDKIIKFTGKTRSKEMTVIEATLAKEFIQFAVDTIITTKSLDKTLNEVKKKYELS
jgi:hypothetical protein